MQSPHSRNAEAALPGRGARRYAGRVMKTTTPDTLISPADLLERLDWRYAVKQFDPALRIDEPTWNALEESLRLSPSSGGLQPWKFVVVADPAVREKLVPAAFGQTQVRDASHLVVFTAKENFGADDVDAHIRNVAAVKQVPVELLAGLRGMLMGGIVGAKDPAAREAWAARQTYLALGVLVASAALLGVDAAPMEGFVLDQFDTILGLKEQGLTATVICALGYRSETDPYASAPKVRFDHDQVFIHV
jgi:nitroreductase